MQEVVVGEVKEVNVGVGEGEWLVQAAGAWEVCGWPGRMGQELCARGLGVMLVGIVPVHVGFIRLVCGCGMVLRRSG